MIGTNACYICGKPGHMLKESLIRRSQEQGKEKEKFSSEEAPSRKRFIALKSRGAGEVISCEVSGK